MPYYTFLYQKSTIFTLSLELHKEKRKSLHDTIMMVRFFILLVLHMKVNKKWLFLGVLAVSLFLVFFVGRKTDTTTGQRSFAVSLDGVTQFRKGLDVSGGTRLVYKISYDKYAWLYSDADFVAIKKTVENIILKNIDNRISKLGVADYKSYLQTLNGESDIVVEIGGIADLDQAKEIIGKTVELEFKLQNKAETTPAVIAARKALAQGILTEATANPKLLAKLVDGRASENIFMNVYSGATLADLPEIYKNNPQYLDSIKDGQLSNILLNGKYTTVESQTKLGTSSGVDLNGFTITEMIQKGTKTLSGKTETTYTFADVFVQDHATWVQAVDAQGNVLNGAYFKYANTSNSQVGEPVVAINFDDKGKEIFCSLTEQNIGQPMAIFIGGQLLTSPTIQSKICGGTAQIDGKFTADSAKELATSLNDGAMPAPLILMQEEKINPSLGTNALTGALIAGLVGVVAIAGLIWAMYGWKKMILTAMILVVFLSVLAAFLKLTDYALSLSGIAAIILSIGMAVDGNILIYERLREELKRGLSIEGAIDTAKDRSWTAIRDGQLSTGLIALVLFSMGVNIFKGFGAMMIVTLLLSLFLNVPLTKYLLHVFYDRKNK